MDKTTQDRPWFKFWPEGVPQHIDYPEVPLFDFLSDAASRYPENTAFSHQGRHLCYRELDALSSKLANGLNKLGIQERDRIVLCLPNSLEFLIGYYGILKAGGTVTLANPLYKKDELKHQINDSEAVAIITGGDSCSLAQDIKDETSLKFIISTDTEAITDVISLERILADFPPDPPQINLKPKEDIAAIEYTGGTTGFPKGAMLTHYNLVANAIQNAAWLDWNNEDIILGLLPFYHSWGACTCVNSPVYSGTRVIIFPRFDAVELLTIIQEQKVTVLHGAASMFMALVNNPILNEFDLSSLKYVKAGAMPIPPPVKDRWEEITGTRMILGYGLSEASPETHNSPPDRVKPGTVGIPIMDTDARIVDEETGETELPPGEVGELVIRGPQVMKGYVNRPEDNKEALKNGWLHTGDLAMIDDEGYFCIVDRKKETIKYKGYTIAPAEVEAALYRHPAVKECAVVGEPDALTGEVPKAYVVLTDGYTPCEEEIIRFCEQQVAPYKRIRQVEFIAEIPKTQVGKVLRRVLKDQGGKV